LAQSLGIGSELPLPLWERVGERGRGLSFCGDPSPVSHLRCGPPSPTRGEGKGAASCYYA
jgi:hypothetical protein